MTVEEILKKIIKFRDRREWKQFHDSKNLAEAISIEAAELLEIFLWDTVKGSRLTTGFCWEWSKNNPGKKHLPGSFIPGNERELHLFSE